MVLQPARRTAGRHCCLRGGLLPRLFTLTGRRHRPRLRYYTLTDVEPLTRAALCVARTFLPPPKRTAIERACIFYLYLLSSLTGRSPVLMPYITSRLRYYICLQRHHLLYLHPRPRHRLRLSGLTISFPAPIRRIYSTQLPRGSYYTHPSRTCGIPVMQPPFGISGPRA